MPSSLQGAVASERRDQPPADARRGGAEDEQDGVTPRLSVRSGGDGARASSTQWERPPGRRVIAPHICGATTLGGILAADDARRRRCSVRDVRVLVVGDHELSRRGVAALIADADGFVLAAAVNTAQQCYDVIAGGNIDLVLMDINMPGTNGFDASRHIAATVAAPVVVLLSTYDEAEVDIGDCGAAGYISKSSFGPQRLVETWTRSTQPNQTSARSVRSSDRIISARTHACRRRRRSDTAYCAGLDCRTCVDRHSLVPRAPKARCGDAFDGVGACVS
jgi:DNA-binding NarL/FixJ family response regulator